jgi:hypothetical protein
MTRPATFPAARVLLVATLTVLLGAVALGLARLGPLRGLGGVTDEVVGWFTYNTDVLFR